MCRLIARLILFPIGLIHLAVCLLVMWLDKQSLSLYLDGLVKARYDMDDFPPMLVIDSKVCRKDTVMITNTGECLARLEAGTDGRLQWIGLSPKVSTLDRVLIICQLDLNEPTRLTKEPTQCLSNGKPHRTS